jgi:rhodanese-related sulfurtransferase
MENRPLVPGAVLLSNSKTYPLAQLPAEKATKLVFYCGAVMCRASDHAAKRAVGAGYTNVNVMREGIKGWAQAGQKTDVPRS